MRVCLSTMSNGSLVAIEAMLESSASYVDEAIIVVAPGHLTELDSATLPMPVTRIEHPWEGYAKTRTIALKQAEIRAEWVLTIDDDDRYAANGEMPPLDIQSVGAYLLPISLGNVTFYRPHLTRRGHNWRFEGCGSSGLHEALYGDGETESRKWDNLTYVSGPPSIPTEERYMEHARLLQIALDQDPSNTRTAFYLAQSLRDAANLSVGTNRDRLGAALSAYVLRGNMPGGFVEEVFWSWMNAGRIAWQLGLPWEACEAFYSYAKTWGPGRAEPIVDMSRLFDAWGKPELSIKMRNEAALLPYPVHARLFVESIYNSLPQLQKS